MRYLGCLFIVLFFLTSAYAAKTPSRLRFEFNFGTSNMDYVENQTAPAFVDQDFKEKSSWSEFALQYYLLPPYFDITASAQYTGGNISEPKLKGDQIEILTGQATLGWVLPQFSEFYQLKLNLERFYMTTFTEDNDFGFRNLVGWQVYPTLEWLTFGSDAFMQISTFFKVPLWTDTGNRRELTAGLKFRIPFGQRRGFPAYAYQTAIILKVFYTDLRVQYENDTGEVEIKQSGASIGFNW
ncbi:MAG: hypothetical protein JNM93_09290 [Bacteriovoracaceae bacterium]|nr:hypothetical protein [Bacteriovoracaceae bacterium]